MISKDPKSCLFAVEFMSKNRGTIILVGQLLPPLLVPATLSVNLLSLS